MQCCRHCVQRAQIIGTWVQKGAVMSEFWDYAKESASLHAAVMRHDARHRVCTSVKWNGFNWQLPHLSGPRFVWLFVLKPDSACLSLDPDLWIRHLRISFWIISRGCADRAFALYAFVCVYTWPLLKWACVRWLLFTRCHSVKNISSPQPRHHQLTHKIAFEHSGEICCLSDQYQQNIAPVSVVVGMKQAKSLAKENHVDR